LWTVSIDQKPSINLSKAHKKWQSNCILVMIWNFELCQGKALNAVASRNVKVLIVGNPCNTKYGHCMFHQVLTILRHHHVLVVACPWCSALICLKNAPNVPAKNFHALTRLDENRAKCQVTDVEPLLCLPFQTGKQIKKSHTISFCS
jgi:hypothetical protein